MFIYLQELVQFVREEVLSGSRVQDIYDPSRPPYEAYTVDFELFHVLFSGISPWGRGDHASDLSARLFRVSTAEMSGRTVQLSRIENWINVRLCVW